MKKILLLGFEPFDQEIINPALEAVKLLDGKKLNGGEIVTSSLPVVHQKSIDTAIKAIELHKPDITMIIGQAGGNSGIAIERVAINIDDYRIKDNEGNQVIDEPIVLDGPVAYFATLPLKAMVKELRKHEIPATVSNSAGTFVCNHIFYGVQHYIQHNNLDIKSGFIHVPFLPEQVTNKATPSMSLEVIAKSLSIASQVAIDVNEDIKMQDGTIY